MQNDVASFQHTLNSGYFSTRRAVDDEDGILRLCNRDTHPQGLKGPTTVDASFVRNLIEARPARKSSGRSARYRVIAP